MGTCSYCVVKVEETPPEEEVTIIQFENQIPTRHIHHSEWVQKIKGVYETNNVLNQQQFAKASGPVGFSIDGFFTSVGTAVDDLCTVLYDGVPPVKGRQLDFNYKSILQLSIMLTEDDQEGVNSKIETFVLSISNDTSPMIAKQHFQKGITFLINLAVYVLPQGARNVKRVSSVSADAEGKTKGQQMQKYLSQLSSTVRPLITTLCKIFFGTRTEVNKDVLISLLRSSREGSALMNSRRMRAYAYKKFQETMRFKEMRLKDTEPSEETKKVTPES
jgi:hypothetical protein